jgi:GDP-L-fucose synthase
MRIFLSGANGMVGRNILSLGEAHSHEIYAPDRAMLDLLDKNALTSYLLDIKPDVVIHCAGRVGGIQANIQSPYDFCFDNLQMGLNIIKASHEVGISRLINLGSSCMYPRAAENPLKEAEVLTGELEPTNEGYAVAKIAVARLADYIRQQHGRAYKTIIPCNLYGFWDKFDLKSSHMIPAVIRKLHEAKTKDSEFVEIWGDGTARREFLFVEDLANFIFFALANFDALPNNMNVGLGFDYSINDYYEMVKKVVGYAGYFKYDLTKPTGMKQKLVDVSLQSGLGWEPQTDIKTGIERTYQYFLSLGLM